MSLDIQLNSSTVLYTIPQGLPGELSDTDSESEMNLLRYYEQQKSTARSDEMVVTAAKEMGRELYSYLPPVERRQKLDAMVKKAYACIALIESLPNIKR